MWSVKQLIESHPELAQRLKRFDLTEAIKLVAGLALTPTLHANAVRIEVLAHLVMVCCRGKDHSTGKDLVEWSKLMSGSPMASQEDPLEYVFVGCVSTNEGSYRLPAGIAVGVDFWCERLLRQLLKKMDFPPFRQTVRDAHALLRLSDALMERAGLERYSASESNPGGVMSVPGRHEMRDLANAVVFDATALSLLGIDPVHLCSFILTDQDRGDLSTQAYPGSLLDRKPLCAVADGIQVLTPSCLGRALERQLIAGLIDTGLGQWTDMFFQNDCANLFVNDAILRMGIEHLKFDPPAAPPGLLSLYPFFGQFDVGKPVIALTFCPSLTGMLADPEGVDELDEAATEALLSFVDVCAERLEKMEGFSGGLRSSRPSYRRGGGYGPDTEIRRNGHELIFAYAKPVKTGLFAGLTSKLSKR